MTEVRNHIHSSLSIIGVLDLENVIYRDEVPILGPVVGKSGVRYPFFMLNKLMQVRILVGFCFFFKQKY